MLMMLLHQTHAFICELIVTTLEISIRTTKVPNSGRDSVGILTTGREPISTDISSNKGVEGGFEESNIST
jgi:hypothetical protein